VQATPQGARHGIGWDVVTATAQAAAAQFGRRLVAVYALGSLAHGGFSPLVSDVDVAVVIDELRTGDNDRVDAIVERVRTGGLRMAERLSLFWAAVGGLSGNVAQGRLPPLDRLDLLRHGVLVQGRQALSAGVEPTSDELVQGAAQFAVEVLGRAERRREILDARHATGGGPRSASKVALFPVRFLYTAQTGNMGLVDAAIAHYLVSAAPGPRRDLVEAAAGWRHRWRPDDEAMAEDLLQRGAVPLYREFVDDYVPRLRRSGLGPLADQLATWGDSLAGAWGDPIG
jgi:hypothetical protein